MRSRGASVLAGSVSTRRRGGAEKDAEKQKRGSGGSGIQRLQAWRAQRRTRREEAGSVSTRRRGGAEEDAEKQDRRRGRSEIHALAGWRSQRRTRREEVRASLGCTRRSLMPLVLAAAVLLPGATRPQYGGTLRVELRQNAETPDPPALLGAGFTIARWEAGRLAVYEADENAAGGRPFLARSEE